MSYYSILILSFHTCTYIILYTYLHIVSKFNIKSMSLNVNTSTMLSIYMHVLLSEYLPSRLSPPLTRQELPQGYLWIQLLVIQNFLSWITSRQSQKLIINSTNLSTSLTNRPGLLYSIKLIQPIKDLYNVTDIH